MKTSYYYKYSRLSEKERNKYYAMSISNTVPQWFVDCGYLNESFDWFCPKMKDVIGLKNNEITQEEFIQNYYYHLNNEIYIDKIMEYFKSIDKEIVFLCHESDKFCHRHILAEFIESYCFENGEHIKIEEL